MDRLSTFVAGSHSLATRIVTVEGLRQLAQVGAASGHSALLFVNIVGGFCQTNLESDSTTSLQCTIRKFPEPPVPAKPNILYNRGMFVDIVCWTVG